MHVLCIKNIAGFFRLGFYAHIVELPWDEPSQSNKEYADWVDSKVNKTPWIKMDTRSLGLCNILVFSTIAAFNMTLILLLFFHYF